MPSSSHRHEPRREAASNPVGGVEPITRLPQKLPHACDVFLGGADVADGETQGEAVVEPRMREERLTSSCCSINLNVHRSRSTSLAYVN